MTITLVAAEAGPRPSLAPSVEQQGLVFAYLLDGLGSGRQIGWQEVKAWTADQGAIWIHLNRSDPAAQRWIRSEVGLDPEAAEALIAADVRPRALPIAKGLLVNLRGINFNAGSDPEDMVALRVYMEGARIITTRHRRIMASEDVRQRIAQGCGPKDATDCLLLLARAMLMRIGDVLEELEDGADQLEDELLSSETKMLRTKLGAIRRRAIAIRRHLAPQREALSRLAGETHALIDERDRAVLRDLADLTMRYVEDIDSLRDRAAVISDEWANRLAESQQRNSYVLTLVAAIILPLSFITSLFGVNIGGMHQGQALDAFWLLLAALGGLALVQLILFKLLRWL
jgi:zinc transporter